MKEEGAEPSGQRRSSFELWGRVGVSMGLECPWGARGWWGRAMVSISRSICILAQCCSSLRLSTVLMGTHPLPHGRPAW